MTPNITNAQPSTETEHHIKAQEALETQRIQCLIERRQKYETIKVQQKANNHTSSKCEKTPANSKETLNQLKKNTKPKKRKGKQANRAEAPQNKNIGNCNAAQNAITQVPKSASSAPDGSASLTTDANGNKENNPANDNSENESQDPGIWRKSIVLFVGDSMVSNFNENH